MNWAGLRAAVQIGAELLFEVFSQRYERGSTRVNQRAAAVVWPPTILFSPFIEPVQHRLCPLEQVCWSDVYTVQPPCLSRRQSGRYSRHTTQTLLGPPLWLARDVFYWLDFSR